MCTYRVSGETSPHNRLNPGKSLQIHPYNTYMHSVLVVKSRNRSEIISDGSKALFIR